MAVPRESVELPISWVRYHHLIARQLAAAISQQAGLLCQVQVLDQVVCTSWQLMESLPPLTIGSQRLAVREQPDTGRRLPAIFGFQSELAQVLVDRLLGGSGRWPGGARLLTELEGTVLRPVLFRFWEATCESWPGKEKLVYEPVAVPKSAGGPPDFRRQLELRSIRELLVRTDAAWRWWVAYFAIHFPVGRGMACFCLPLELVEQPAASDEGGVPAQDAALPVNEAAEIAQPSALAGDPKQEEASAEESEVKDRGGDQPAEVAVVLGQVRLHLDDLLKLERGDVLKLEQPVNGELAVYVNGTPAWLAQPGTYRGRMAVRLLREHSAAKEVVSA
ncbi:MAG: FliM/FliN family flagellar motor switch protein [Bacteroidota bacterium]